MPLNHSFRSFTFDLLYFGDGDDQPPCPELFRILATFCTSLKQLRKLLLVIPGLYIESSASQFRTAKVMFHNVHTLVVGPYCEFVISSCPNVKTIATNGSGWRARHRYEVALPERLGEFLKAARQAPKVTHLQVHDWYTIACLKGKFIDTIMISPMTKSSRITESCSEDTEAYCWGQPLLRQPSCKTLRSSSMSILILMILEAYLPVLARFERLHYLALADACYLDIGAEILTPQRDYQEARIQHIKAANKKVAEMVITACKSLRVLWIGKIAKAIITRYPDSSLVDVAWYAEEREDVVDFRYRE